jgi:hypothetical protein
MNYDIVKPAFAQDIAFAEPEEEKNAGPYDNDDKDDLTLILQPPVILDVVMRLKEQ